MGFSPSLAWKSKSFYSSGAALPMIPPMIPGALGPDGATIRVTLRAKRRSRKFSPSAPSSPYSPNPYFTGFATGSSSIDGNELAAVEFVNLFNVYGNIFLREDGLILSYSPDVPAPNSMCYCDESLLLLFENSVKCWYFDPRRDRKLPAILSLHGPSRASTWALSRHLAEVSASHLARIPFSLFYELIQAVWKQNQSQGQVQSHANFSPRGPAGPLGQFVMNSVAPVMSKSVHQPNSTATKMASSTSLSKESASSYTRSVIQVLEYLFACMEAAASRSQSLNSPVEERFTLFLDGIEEFLLTRRGGDACIRDLITWANIFENTGRRIIFGGRSQMNSNVEVVDSKDSSEEDSNSTGIFGLGGGSNNGNGPNHSSNNNNHNNSNSIISPLQALADLFIKSSSSSSSSSASASSPPSQKREDLNVHIDGGILRFFLTGPQSDRRKRLQFSQLLSHDRQADLFDSNVSFIKTLAQSKWNLGLDLSSSGLPISASRHSFPSEDFELFTRLKSVGGGVLVKRRLSRDEISELVLFLLGSGHKYDEMKRVGVAAFVEGLDHLANIRRDPNKFSSDDLNHLLAERQVSSESLTKYERRFITCLSTATTQTRFQDVSLPEKTIETLRSVTTLPLLKPELFTSGVLKHSLTGVLLFGPPGTGKTMLARAVAQESGASFLAVNMSNIFDMWVGEGEKNVKGLFGLARKLAPAIIFIDEIDALLERRSSISGRSSRLEIVNEFMSQWDGLSSNLNAGVMVMGATNRPFVLDDAVLRRLPRRLLIDLPSEGARLQIITSLIRDNELEFGLLEWLPHLARVTELYSGSDLKNVAVTAGLRSAQRTHLTGNGPMVLKREDFEAALREVPASLSDHMESLVELRKWNETFGEISQNNVNNRRRLVRFGFS